jgi:hypothetical protein
MHRAHQKDLTVTETERGEKLTGRGSEADQTNGLMMIGDQSQQDSLTRTALGWTPKTKRN